MTNGHFPIMDYMGSLTVRHEYTTQIVTQNIFASNVVKNITEGNRKGISTIFCTEGQHKVIYSTFMRGIYTYTTEIVVGTLNLSNFVFLLTNLLDDRLIPKIWENLEKHILYG